MTPDKNFRLKKPYKTMLALMKGSKEQKDGWKRLLIEGQLHEEAARRAALKSNEVEARPPRPQRGAVAPE